MTKYRIEFEINKMNVSGLDLKETIVSEIIENIENYKQIKNLEVLEK